MIADAQFGELLLPTSGAGGGSMTVWSDCLFNRIAVGGSILLVLLSVNAFIRIFPSIAYGFSKRRGHLLFEHNLSLTRTRDLLDWAMALPFLLIADRFGLYGARFLEAVPPGWSVAALLGVFTAYFLIRRLCYRLLCPSSLGKEEKDAAESTLATYFIVLVPLMFTAIGISLIFSISDEAIRTVFLVLAAATLLASIYKSGQILAGQCGFFSTFLYLCALELVPAGLLFATAQLL